MLKQARVDLEIRVDERTSELKAANKALQKEIRTRTSMEEQLIRTQRLRTVTELSAGVSHNLNNILTCVLGPAQLIRRMTDDPDIVREIDDIISSATRARDLVSRLNQTVRGGDDRTRPVAVPGVIADAVHAARPRRKDEPEAGDAPVELVTELEDVPPVAATETGLHNILLNLIFNAVDAMPEGGRVVLRARPVNDDVEITVSDTSIGTFVREVDLPRELVFGSYWARAAFSEDGRHLYFTGPFNTQAVYLSTVGPKGRLGPWQATRSMPASQNGRRSLHQIFVAGRRLHVLGGWWADNNPGIRQIHAAVVGQAGAVGPFRLLSARVPFVEVAFSLARCGGRIYLARGDTIWVSARGEQGALTAFEPALTDARLQHENYGGTGLACGGDTLVLADEARTHLLHLGRKGRPALVQSLQNPAPFRRRTVFCHRGRFFVTTTHGGRIYRLSR